MSPPYQETTMYRLFLPSLFLAILLAPRAALAIAPNYISDQDLALVPIIVEAVWEKAAFKENWDTPISATLSARIHGLAS